jgi:hypothetical protein
MFAIRYRIPEEEIREISSLDVAEFDADFNDIEGQIELDFHGNKYGFCHEQVPFGQELLLFWFGLLNSVAVKLRKAHYVAMSIPETTASFFEFFRIGEFLKISLVTVATSDINGFIVESPLSDVIQYDWKDVQVLVQDFQCEVSQKIEDFLKELETINPELLKSKCVKSFIEEYKGSNLST